MKMRANRAFWMTVSTGPVSSVGDDAFMSTLDPFSLPRMKLSTSARSCSVLMSAIRALRFVFMPKGTRICSRSRRRMPQ